jgi:superfamily II DNA or RNA helicase
MELWPFQLEENRKVWIAFRDGAKAVLLQAACGAGKTVMCSHMIHMRKEHMRETSIVLAHRREIVYQAARKLEDAGLKPSILMAGHIPDSWGNVFVGSVDTVWSDFKRTKRLPEAEFLVIDECHRIADRYLKIIKEYREAGGLLLGLTATPMRQGGIGLGDIFDVMVRGPETNWLIDQGYLCRPSYRVGIVPDVSGVKLVAGEYNQGQLEAVMNQKLLIGDIVENWLHYAKDRKTMIFASGVKHSMYLMNQFLAAGVAAVHVDGQTDKAVRDDVFKKSESGEIRVICNAQVYIEGVDFPWIDCVVDAQPTKSLTRYLQKDWRAGRAYPGKKDFLVMDHANNVYVHGRLETPRDWELCKGTEQVEKLAAQRKKSEKVQLRCHVCGFIIHSPICEHCGTPLQMIGKQKAFLPGMLVDMTEAEWEERTAVKADKPGELFKKKVSDEQAFYSGLIDFGERSGFKSGWAKNKFHEKYGTWPDKLNAVSMTPRKAVKEFIRESMRKYQAQKKAEKAVAA